MEGAPRAWWFGGGTDITPSYVFEEDMKHFHGVCKIWNFVKFQIKILI